MLHPEALGWTLLHFCWQATAIALIYGICDRALHAADRRTRYGLALAALLAMAGAACVTLIHEEGLARFSATAGVATGQGGAWFAGAGARGSGAAVQAEWRGPFDSRAVLLWLDMLWFLGVALLTVRAIGGWIVLRRMVRDADADLPDPLPALVARLGARLGLRRPVAVRLSWDAAGPFVTGLFRAVLVVPVSTLTALSPDQLEAVLAHELAHVRRADYCWNILQTLIETLFFFHPAVWWIGRRLRDERELCCDDMAVAVCGDPLAYATALYTLEAGRGSSPPLALALDGHRPASALRRRIAHILGEPARPPHRAAPLMLAGLAVASLCLLAILPDARAAIMPAPRWADPVSPAKTTPAPAPMVAIAARVSATVRARAVSAAPPARAPDMPVPPSPQVAEPADYAAAMAAAGYTGDARALVWLKELGVTPDYVRSIVELGLGSPNAKQIRILWEHGTRPAAFYSAVQAVGGAPTTLYDFVGYSLYGVTPALITGLREAGFDAIPPGRLARIARLGVTPAYARAAKQAQPDLDSWHLVHKAILERSGAGTGWSGDG